jgi:predicted  nucleic acid-binding Zn-ribbon protein
MALSASPENQELLLELQELDTRLAQLAHRASHLPELATLADLSTRAESTRADLAVKRGAAEDVAAELGRIEADVRVVQERIARDSDRIQSSSSVKDVAALEQELAALRKRLSDLEDIEIAVMERQEEAEAELAAAAGELESIASAIAAAEAGRDAGLAVIASERVTAEKARAELVAQVPADLLALYERQRERYGVGASLLQHGVSKASGVALTEDELQSIRAAAPDTVIICPSSDAILVRTAESGL